MHLEKADRPAVDEGCLRVHLAEVLRGRLLHGLQEFELVAREGAASHALRLITLRGVEVAEGETLAPGEHRE